MVTPIPHAASSEQTQFIIQYYAFDMHNDESNENIERSCLANIFLNTVSSSVVFQNSPILSNYLKLVRFSFW